MFAHIEMFQKNDFSILQKIKEGPFWQTFIAKTETKNDKKSVYFEVRVMRKSKVIEYGEEKRILDELKERKRMCNPYIQCVYSNFQDYDNCFLVSEFSSAGYLYYFLKEKGTFPLDISRFFITEIILAIQYLHKNKMLYCLLSPENIMVSCTGHVKLRFDFKNKIGFTEKQYKNTINYIPVDYLKEERLSPASDYWSIGIVLYEFLYGFSPFDGRTYEECVYNMQNKRLVFPTKISEEVEDLLTRLLDRYNFRRLGAKKKDRYLIRQHKFFDGIDWASFKTGKVDSPFYYGDFKPSDDNLINMEDAFPENHKKNNKDDGYGEIFSPFGKPNNSIQEI